jgi:hypothetical protein
VHGAALGGVVQTLVSQKCMERDKILSVTGVWCHTVDDANDNSKCRHLHRGLLEDAWGGRRRTV